MVRDEEFYLMFGFKTDEELTAYEKGRSDEQKVLEEWIKKWNGETNSSLGKLLMDKIEELNKPNIQIITRK